MSTNELEMKCRELRQLQNLIEEAQAEAEAIKDAIKAHMGDAEAVQAGEYKITWKNVVSSRFDSQKFKADHADLYSQYSKQTTTTPFCVGA